MYLSLATGPATEPVSLQEAQDQVRTGGEAQDPILNRLIKVARQKVEEDTDRALITQTWDAHLHHWPRSEIQLPKGQLQSVTSVQYTPAGGDPETLDPATYELDTVSEPGRLVLASGSSWPVATLAAVNPIRVRYVCGFSVVPETLKQAILMLIGHFWENVEAVAMEPGIVVITTPLGYDRLIQPWIL